jgi:hypothetical protein
MRKRKLLWLIPLVWAVVLLLCVNVQAEPFLVCDPQTDADGYMYKLNGGAEVIVPYTTAVMGGRTVAVIADLAPLPIGPFSFQVKAYSIWGQSSEVPFAASKQLPGSVSRMVISR